MPLARARLSVDAMLQTLRPRAIDAIGSLARNGCQAATAASVVASGCGRTARAPHEAAVPLARRGGGLGHVGARARVAPRVRPRARAGVWWCMVATIGGGGRGWPPAAAPEVVPVEGKWVSGVTSDVGPVGGAGGACGRRPVGAHNHHTFPKRRCMVGYGDCMVIKVN